MNVRLIEENVLSGKVYHVEEIEEEEIDGTKMNGTMNLEGEGLPEVMFAENVNKENLESDLNFEKGVEQIVSDLELEIIPEENLEKNSCMEDTVSEPDTELNVENFSKQKDYALDNEGADIKRKGARKTFQKVRSSNRVISQPNKFFI